MNKRTKTTLIITGSIVFAVIVAFGIRGIIKAKEDKDKEREDQNDGEIQDDPAETAAYNPDPLAREIKQNIEGYNLRVYPETAKKILVLTDSELKKLYQHYNKKYAKDYPTLTQLFQNEWSDWDGYYKRVVNRLKSLKLY